MNLDRILEVLGVEVTKSGAREIKAKCPVHGGDDPNFNINAETGMWMCHSHCGGGNIQQLVSRVLGLKGKEATAWLKEQDGLLEAEPKIDGESLVRLAPAMFADSQDVPPWWG